MAISAAEMSRRLKPLLEISKLEKLVEIEIRKNESELIEYKRQEYEVGNIYGNVDAKAEYSLSSKVKKGGKELYRDYKNKLNPKPGLGNVDLILTGSFIESFKLLSRKNGKYLFNATDSKKNMLKGMYGDIFGLTDVHFDDYLDKYVINDFIKVLKKQLGQ